MIFYTIPTCDGRTDRQTDRNPIAVVLRRTVFEIIRLVIIH